MKKIQIMFIALSMAIATPSCQTERRKHVTIETTVDDHTKLKIEYAGRIVFSADAMSITSMSPNSYFKFKRDDEKLEAQSDANGHIVYKYNGGVNFITPDTNAKRLLAEAVGQIVKAQRKNKG